LHRLLNATVQLSLTGSAQKLDSDSKPASPLFEPLQLPEQQSLLSVHCCATATQHGVLTETSHTAPFGPASTSAPTPVESLVHGSPVAAIESKARAKHGTRRFIALQA